MQHPLGAEILFSEKVDLGWYYFTIWSLKLVDQSLPDFFRLMWEESRRSNTCPVWNIFICSGDIHCQSLKSFEIAPNFTCFWPLRFFWRGKRAPQVSGPSFQNSAYYRPPCKILRRSADGARRYHGEQIKHLQQNISLLQKLSLPGGLNCEKQKVVICLVMLSRICASTGQKTETNIKIMAQTKTWFLKFKSMEQILKFYVA